MDNELIKVLVVGPDRCDPGGVANYYNAIFPRLSNSDVEAHYLSIGSTHGQQSRMHVLTDQLRFWRAIGRVRPDVVHLNPSLDMRSFLRDGLFIFLAKLRRQRVLVFFRGWQTTFESKVEGPLHWFFVISYKRADAFIVLAKQFAERLRDWEVLAPIFQATTTVSDELLENFSIEEKVDQIHRTPVVRLLYLARLEMQKGVLELLEAVSLILQEGGEVELTIAGDGPLMGEVLADTSRLGDQQSRVNIVGYVRGKDKMAILKDHHIYCFPTQYGEGMPNSVLEAMAFGMPVITCPVGGLADFFVDERMGALLQDQDAGRMAKSITKLIASRDKLASMAQYNYEYAKDNFLASIVADTLRRRYIDMVNK